MERIEPRLPELTDGQSGLKTRRPVSDGAAGGTAASEVSVRYNESGGRSDASSARGTEATTALTASSGDDTSLACGRKGAAEGFVQVVQAGLPVSGTPSVSSPGLALAPSLVSVPESGPRNEIGSLSQGCELTPTPNASSACVPTAEEERRSVPMAAQVNVAQPATLFGQLTWLISVVLFMLLVRYFVPWFVEEIQYAIVRGTQRAEYEWAGQQLAAAGTSPLSVAGQTVAKRIAPSVVHISIKMPQTDEEAVQTWWPHPFAAPQRRLAGQGSGVIVDASGYILTNYHVVKEATEITVRLSDGRRVPARLINYDEITDLAVLKIEASGLIAAQWGDSERLEVGSQVWAVGSPFGLEHSLTTGILSAKHRGSIAGSPHQDFLQTDAPINPGNSGGPLVDEQGRVVGINTAIVGEAYQGVSFAIPSHVARSVFEQLRQKGKVQRGWLGVQMDEVSEDVASQLQLEKPYGALVVQVVDIQGRSPAREAGIQEGDVIVAWNDHEVRDPATLSRLVAQTAAGSTALVRVRRGNAWLDLSVRVGQHPASR
jgi:serine protease Do